MYAIIERNSLVVKNIETRHWNRILKSYRDKYCEDKHLYFTVTCYVTLNAFTMKREPKDIFTFTTCYIPSIISKKWGRYILNKTFFLVIKTKSEFENKIK